MTTPKLAALRPVQGLKDPIIRHLRDITTPAGRLERRTFFAQSPLLATRAFEFGAQPVALILAQTFIDTPEATELRAQAHPDCPVYTASEGILSRFLGKRPAPRCAIITPRRVASLEALATPGALLQVVEDLENPDNLGMLMRSAEAAGVTGLVLTGASSCDPFTRRAVRASRGAVYTLPIAISPDPLATLAELRARGLQVVASSANVGTPYDAIDCTKPTALLVGNEHVGLSQAALDASDVVATIPMAGRVNSLNVSVAATVLMYEAARQRRAQPKPS